MVLNQKELGAVLAFNHKTKEAIRPLYEGMTLQSLVWDLEAHIEALWPWNTTPNIRIVVAGFRSRGLEMSESDTLDVYVFYKNPVKESSMLKLLSETKQIGGVKVVFIPVRIVNRETIVNTLKKEERMLMYRRWLFLILKIISILAKVLVGMGAFLFLYGGSSLDSIGWVPAIITVVGLIACGLSYMVLRSIKEYQKMAVSGVPLSRRNFLQTKKAA